MEQELYPLKILEMASLMVGGAKKNTALAYGKSHTCGAQAWAHITLEQGRIKSYQQHIEASVFGQAAAAFLEKNACGWTQLDIKTALECLFTSSTHTHPPQQWKDELLTLKQLVPKEAFESFCLPFHVISKACQKAQ